MTLPWRGIRAHEQALSRQLLAGLSQVGGLTLLGEAAGRTGPRFSHSTLGHAIHDICQMLDGYGVALRGGHHFAQPLMQALGLVATSRASIAVFNTDADIAALLCGLHDAVETLR